MTTDTANEPVAGYDGLKERKSIASLFSRSQLELGKIESYERTHQGREEVALDDAELPAIKRVRGYERKFRARREVLDEVIRLHRERRVPLVSRGGRRPTIGWTR